ncbi:MAG: DMT family transporter [Lachnospirales bacterium]
MNKKMLGDFGLLFVTVLWGGGFVAADIALETATTFQIMALRFTLALFLLCAIYYKHLKRINLSIVLKGSLIGIFLFMAFYFQTEGLVYTTATNNAFITTMNIIFVPFISYFFFKSKIDIFSIIGAVLAFIGVALLTITDSITSINYGDFLTLLCAITFAIQIVLIGKFSKETKEPILLTIIQIASCTILSIAFLLIAEPTPLTNISTRSMYGILYLAIFSTAVGFTIQTACQMLTTDTRAVIFMSFEGVFGSFFSVIVLHEVITNQMYLGAFIMFVAIMIVQIPDIVDIKKKVKL